MIELRRAKMGLPPITLPATVATTAGTRPGGLAGPTASGGSAASAASNTSGIRVSSSSQVSSAAEVMESEDERMHRFLTLLSASSQETDEPPDTKPRASLSLATVTIGNSGAPPAIRRGPTVPTALSRRMLHRQGAGYLDDNVAAIASAAADRFLATVLQQAAACRDRRLKGEELAKRERRERRRHRKRRRAESDERRRKKAEEWKKRRDKNLAAVRAADALAATKAAAGSSGSSSKSKSKKSKKANAQGNEPKIYGVTNGGKVPSIPNVNHELSDDSVDEEEDYYEDYYGEVKDSADDSAASDDSEDDDDDDEDSRYALLLRDIQRPLAAWGVTLTGKIGLGTKHLGRLEKDDEGEKSSDINTGLSEGVMTSNSGPDADGISSVVAVEADSPAIEIRSSPPKSPAMKPVKSGAATAGISTPETKKAETKQNIKFSPAIFVKELNR